MSVSQGDTDRRIVPRWRFSEDYGSSCEYSGDAFRESQILQKKHFVDASLDRWKSSRSISSAIDAVAAGVTYGQHQVVESPATFLLDNEVRILPGARSIAELVVRKSQDTETIDLPVDESKDVQSLASAVVRTKRNQLRKYPRNPIALIDMARAYTILGITEKAENSLNMALYLAPNHRIILRTLSRFLIHVGDLEKAHHLLESHSRTKRDPWLMSSEIAAAAVAGKTSKLIKSAKKIIERKEIHDGHATELQSALATEYMHEGRSKQARQMFERSLQIPNDNSVAQANWARKHLASLNMGTRLNISRGYEARAYQAVSDERWEDARNETMLWQMDEPFSSRPAVFGSHLGVSVLGDNLFALKCADVGLLADPSDTTLLNNKAVALAYMGNIEGAVNEMRKISSHSSVVEIECVRLATSGLIEFMLNNLEKGRGLYEEAYKLAPPHYKPRVLIHWATEEIRHHTAKAPELTKLVDEVVKKSKDPYILKLQQVLFGGM